ncbi:hypothetical protein [Nocardia asiatica]|uniref:hypothetical protein n=1 Tax=Nocardia asiatica TaxID=209252 RepID=UPI0024576365|nr:hypothetical protein [Nocardia asiatica]
MRELPAPIRTNSDEHSERWLIDEFVAALKEHPGLWAKWPVDIRVGTVSAYRDGIKKGTLRAFRDGKFDATRRNSVLYVRYVGEGVSDDRA